MSDMKRYDLTGVPNVEAIITEQEVSYLLELFDTNGWAVYEKIKKGLMDLCIQEMTISSENYKAVAEYNNHMNDYIFADSFRIAMRENRETKEKSADSVSCNHIPTKKTLSRLKEKLKKLIKVVDKN